jgi:hypothetical protein
MDISGIASVLLKEYHSSKGLSFENHLYGCFSLLEQVAEGSVEVSGTVLQFAAPFDVSGSWASIGLVHGFQEDTQGFEGSHEYRATWLPLMTNRVRLEEVDALEDCVFVRLREAGAVQFVAALDVDKGSETEAKTTALPSALPLTKPLAEPLPKPLTKHLNKRRTRHKRTVTPIKRHYRYAKTRRLPKHGASV